MDNRLSAGTSSPGDSSVDELFSRWDIARQHGQIIAPEELCRDCPHHLAELQRRIDSLPMTQVMPQLAAAAGRTHEDSSLASLRSEAETKLKEPVRKTVEEVKSFLAPPHGPDELGRLGPYRVLKVLGAGGMGVVLLAEDSRLHRQVALKLMAPSRAADTRARERFLREAQAAAAVAHEHIVAIFEVGEENGVPYLVMPFLMGESLESRLAREGRLKIEQAVRIGREIADGLAAAHEWGLIHRDIKPGNIWLEAVSRQRSAISQTKPNSGDQPAADGSSPTACRVKILDFGLARVDRDDVHLTGTGEVLGTPAYMSPEQAAGEVVDQRTDLFSLGAVLYRMVTGERPFPGKSLFALINSLAHHQPRAPHELNVRTPLALSRLILKLLNKDRCLRPCRAADIANELAELEGSCSDKTEESGVAVHPLPALAPASSPPSTRRRKLRTSSIIAALVFLGLVTMAVIILRDRDTSDTHDIVRDHTPEGGGTTVDPKKKPAGLVPEKSPPKNVDASLPPEGWKVYRSVPGRFTVWLPGLAKEKSSAVKTASGDVQQHQATLNDTRTGIFYSAVYAEYPGVTFGQVQSRLDAARDGALRKGKARLLSEAPIEFGKFPGREIYLEVPTTNKARIRMRMYLIEQRLYQLLVGGKDDLVTSKDAEQFLSSFQLVADN